MLSTPGISFRQARSIASSSGVIPLGLFDRQLHIARDQASADSKERRRLLLSGFDHRSRPSSAHTEDAATNRSAIGIAGLARLPYAAIHSRFGRLNVHVLPTLRRSEIIS